MQRRSFLKTLACGLLATKLAFDLGAKSVEVAEEETRHEFNPHNYSGEWVWRTDPCPLRFRFVEGIYIPWEDAPFPETYQFPNYDYASIP